MLLVVCELLLEVCSVLCAGCRLLHVALVFVGCLLSVVVVVVCWFLFGLCCFLVFVVCCLLVCL